MKVAPLAEREEERLEALNAYQVLDTLPEKDFDDLTMIASEICQTPIALVSLVDHSRQWFKAKTGLSAEETPRDVAFCSHAILQDKVFEVSDSDKDERFHDNPLVTSEPHVKFYAGAPLKTSSGLHIGTLCVIDHQPRQLKEGQKKALEALASQVVSQLELRKSRREAEEAVKTKARFLANMSHEIRTPMNGVISCTNLLLDQIHKAENVKLLKVISASGHTLLALINDILDFSKMESGKMELEEEAFGLRDSVTDVVELFQSQAKEKRVAVSVKIDEAVPHWVLGDVTRFRQVMSNLVSNAIKFTQTRVDIELKSKVSSSSRHQIFCSVKDDGSGIDEQGQTKLFRDFSQTDGSVNRKFGGTGLGLSICRGLVRAMGGEIGVESQPGAGACFYFTICLSQANPPAQRQNREEMKNFLRLAEKHPLRILLAEDNSVNQMVAKKLLEKLGYRVDVAGNGQEAVEAVKNKQYDVILMDQKMPVMDGLQATQEIRQLEVHQPKIYALTASVFKEDRELCHQVGMDGFISKPIVLVELATHLKQAPPNTEMLESPSHTDIIDWESLDHQFAGETEFLLDLVQQNVSEVPKHLVNIEEALRQNDILRLEFEAHALKNRMANFRARHALEAALALEWAAKEKRSEDVDELYASAKNKVEKVQSDLQAFLRGQRAA